ncbi:MAG TPA: GGDEF domain-containing protein [Bacteroidetes bacterium]|nr:GGDEF domain-containing protein [Bacteroidota bacterium]
MPERNAENSGGRTGLTRVDELRKEIRELEKVNQELSERVLELDMMYQMLRSVASTLDLGEMLETLKTHFRSDLNIDRYAFFVKRGEEDALELQGHFGLAGRVRRNLKLPLHGALRQLVRKGRHYYRDLARTDSPLSELMGSEGSLVVYALRSTENEVVGLLALGRKAPNAFSKRELTFLEKLAQQLGNVVGTMLVFERTREMSFTDPLTGVSNRRYFNQMLVREFERARRYGRALSVLMIDIDHFKDYNDTHGHLAGDAVLRKLANELSDSIRRTDFLARYGGEEFVILLPETTWDRAVAVAEKLRRKVQKAQFNGEALLPEGKLTISVGVASYPQHAEDPLTLLDVADRSLYQAKAAGRNRVGTLPREVPPERADVLPDRSILWAPDERGD